MPTVSSIKDFWNKKAKENAYWYVSSYGPYGERNLDEFWRSGQAIWDSLKACTGYSPDSSHTVVEIGCGVGRISKAIAEQVGTVQAFDISSEMLDIARSKVPGNVKLHLADGFSLRPLSDHYADFALAYCVFQHLPNLSALHDYLTEMVRVVKPGATIAFTTCSRDWKWSLLPVIRAKALIKGTLSLQPPDLHTKEWLGIRPSRTKVQSVCPVRLNSAELSAERILFWGQT